MGKEVVCIKRILLSVFVLSFFLLAGCSQFDAQEASTTFPFKETQSLIILDKDGVKVSYTGLNLTQYLPDQPDGYMLTVGLVIENTSDTDITIFPLDSSVNGVAKIAVSGMPLTALNKKTVIAGFSFANLEGTGINSAGDLDKIENIEFCLSVTDNDTLNEMFLSEPIVLTP